MPSGFRFAVKAPTASSAGSTRSRSGCWRSATGSVASASSSSGRETTACSSCCSARPTRRSATRSTSATRRWDGVEERLAEAGAVRVGDTAGARGLGVPALPRAALRRPRSSTAIAGRARAAHATRHRDVRVLPARRRPDAARCRRVAGSGGSPPALESGHEPRLDAIGIVTADMASLVPLLPAARRGGRAPTAGEDHPRRRFRRGSADVGHGRADQAIDARLAAAVGQRLGAGVPLRLAGRWSTSTQAAARGGLRVEERAVGRVLGSALRPGRRPDGNGVDLFAQLDRLRPRSPVQGGEAMVRFRDSERWLSKAALDESRVWVPSGAAGPGLVRSDTRVQRSLAPRVPGASSLAAPFDRVGRSPPGR